MFCEDHQTRRKARESNRVALSSMACHHAFSRRATMGGHVLAVDDALTRTLLKHMYAYKKKES
ncbi:MAG: hypothetical protein ACK55Z_35440, partial [bacterium]